MGVPRANIVISKVLNHSERRDTRLIERHVIRGADGFDHISPYSDIPQRREPSIKNLFRRLVILHVEAVRWACSRIIVQVNGDLATGGIITKVLVHVSAGAQQALFLTSPECNRMVRRDVHERPSGFSWLPSLPLRRPRYRWHQSPYAMNLDERRRGQPRPVTLHPCPVSQRGHCSCLDHSRRTGPRPRCAAAAKRR